MSNCAISSPITESLFIFLSCMEFDGRLGHGEAGTAITAPIARGYTSILGVVAPIWGYHRRTNA